MRRIVAAYWKSARSPAVSVTGTSAWPREPARTRLLATGTACVTGARLVADSSTCSGIADGDISRTTENAAAL